MMIMRAAAYDPVVSAALDNLNTGPQQGRTQELKRLGGGETQRGGANIEKNQLFLYNP